MREWPQTTRLTLVDGSVGADSVLDGREHDGMLGRVGKPIRSRTKQNIKK
jgi:hypothetical protein